MRRPSFFFVWLLATVLVVTVPLLGIHAWTLYRDLHDAREKAYDEVRVKSAGAGRAVEATLDRAERLLAFVAKHDDSELRSICCLTRCARGPVRRLC